MTSEQLAIEIRRVATTDDVEGLCLLAQAIRRLHQGDPEGETVARQADLKRQRLIASS